jgi:hypothetical protein
VKGAANIAAALRRGLQNSLRNYQTNAYAITMTQVPAHHPGAMTVRRGRPVRQVRSQHSRHYGSLRDNILAGVARSQPLYYVFNAGQAFWVRFLDQGSKPRNGKYLGFWRRVTQDVIDRTKIWFPEGIRAAGLEVRT